MELKLRRREARLDIQPIAAAQPTLEEVFLQPRYARRVLGAPQQKGALAVNSLSQLGISLPPLASPSACLTYSASSGLRGDTGRTSTSILAPWACSSDASTLLVQA